MIYHYNNNIIYLIIETTKIGPYDLVYLQTYLCCKNIVSKSNNCHRFDLFIPRPNEMVMRVFSSKCNPLLLAGACCWCCFFADNYLKVINPPPETWYMHCQSEAAPISTLKPLLYSTKRLFRQMVPQPSHDWQ